MEEIKKHQPGTFSWIDLATTDVESAKKFYTELFGFTAIDTPAGDDMVYTMLQLHGKPVAGLSQMSEEQREQGIPPHWLSYVTVEDVDAKIEKVKVLDGKVLMDPFDVMDVGRMALLQDPTGAVLALWQPKEHIGASFKNIPGTLCWNELVTNDTEKAKAFYTQLFDWGSQSSEMIGMIYTSYMIGEESVAGMYKITEEITGVPSHWMPYIAVEDCDQCVAKAQELGAKVLQPATDIPEVGRFAVLQDPQGAAIAVIKMEAQE
jgi:predicted enzyme related to lactoylglutathione lyase